MTDEITHKVTCTDFKIDHRRAGTTARCVCGWVDRWEMQGGNAEASGAAHVAKYAPKPEEYAQERAIVVITPSPLPTPPSAVQETHSHNCSCHINPPCGSCENCKHWDEPDCDNDCQDCDIDHDL